MNLKQIALCLATVAALGTSLAANRAVSVKPLANATPAPGGNDRRRDQRNRAT